MLSLFFLHIPPQFVLNSSTKYKWNKLLENRLHNNFLHSERSVNKLENSIDNDLLVDTKSEI